ALYHGAHMVVIGELHALGEGGGSDVRDAPAELAPVSGSQCWPLREWLLAIGVHRAAHLGEHQYGAADGLEEIEVRAQVRELGSCIAPQQGGGVPAGNTCEAEAPEHGGEFARAAGKFVPELHALEADLPRLLETGLERDVRAELAHVVVGPDDGIRAEAEGHEASSRRLRRARR